MVNFSGLEPFKSMKELTEIYVVTQIYLGGVMNQSI